uniref:Putative methyltransferase n=1 Tax=viral metagenome TaxID=1070528 RepID=A0A6M3KVV3_9ZZZZ
MGTIFFDDIKLNHIPEILHEIYIDRIYDPFLIGRQNLVIMDIGANIGLTSMYFSKFAKIVYAFEPSVQHLPKLQKLVSENGLTNVKVLPFAISDNTGERKLYHYSGNPTMHSLTKNDSNDFEMVQCISIDKFLENENLDHVDFCKLDAEGEEGKIISSEEFIRNVNKIKTLVGEWHEWDFMSKKFFEETLKRYGYHFKWMNNVDGNIFTAIKE